MKKLTIDELDILAKTRVESADIDVWKDGYRQAEEKHLKTIAKLQKILRSHRVVIEVMYAPKDKPKK